MRKAKTTFNMNKKFDLKANDYLDSAEGKLFYNLQHFAESAPRYDLATRGLSLGQDGSWKRALVGGLPPKQGAFCLDVACGTGDVTGLLAEKYSDGEIEGVDLTPEMIRIAEERNKNPRVHFRCGDMSRLDLPDRSVDILTGSYAIRNAPDLETVLAEFGRVMKAGGRAAFLDFSKPRGKWRQSLQCWLLKLWGGFWGLVLHGNPEVHGYISSSIRTFPDREELESLFSRYGFQLERSQPFLSGMVRLYFLIFVPSSTIL